MTIYLSILKEFLIKHITHWQTKSIAKDQSPGNALATLFNKGRNEDLSKIKRSIAGTLASDIQGFKDTGSDLKNLNGIEELITQAKIKATDEARLKVANQGTFPTMANQTYNLAKDIYEKFKAFKLLDLQFSPHDPLDIYRYYLSAYLAHKVYDIYHPSLIKYYAEHPNVSDMSKLTQEREEAVYNSLERCMQKLDNIDKSKLDYLNERKVGVLESIEALQIKNNELCKKHQVTFILPVISVGVASLNMEMPPLQPDTGCIEVCMEAATAMIAKIKIITHVPEPKGPTINDYFKQVPPKPVSEADKQELSLQ